MKLAEALSERADLKRRLGQLKYRLENNALAQEGDRPAEDPQALLSELTGVTERLEALVTAINLTNASTHTEDGRTLTSMLAQRDVLGQKVAIYRDFLDHASEKVYLARGKEIKIHSTVDVAALRKQVDAAAKSLRELDVTIQGINWTTELQM